MQTKKALSTTLDRLPLGDASINEDVKVSDKLPEGVKSKDLYKDIVHIAWPSFVELLLTQLASMVDMMMVGRIGGDANPELGVNALTAVGLTTQPKFLLMTAFVAMNTGVTALIARYKGQGDKEKANQVLRQGMMLTFLSTLILSILGVIFSRPMVIFMGGKEEVIINQATIYLQIQLAGFATVALTSTITAALRAVGDSRTCMIYNLIANLVNVVFNWLLIGGNLGFPKLGVAGASIATVFGQLVAHILLTVHVDDRDVVDVHFVSSGATAAAEVQGDLVAVAHVKGLLKQNPIGTVGGADVLAGDLAVVGSVEHLHVDAVRNGLVPEAQLIVGALVHGKGLVGSAAPAGALHDDTGTAFISGLVGQHGLLMGGPAGQAAALKVAVEEVAVGVHSLGGDDEDIVHVDAFSDPVAAATEGDEGGVTGSDKA